MMVCPTYPVQKCQELGSIISGHGGGSVLNLSRACKQEERREEDEVAVSHRFVHQSMWPNPVSVVLLHYTGRGKKITGQRCSLGRVIFKYYQNIVEIKKSRGANSCSHSLPENAYSPCARIFAVCILSGTRQRENLPCVCKKTHGKQKTHGNHALHRVPSPITRRTWRFVVCQPAGTRRT